MRDNPMINTEDNEMLMALSDSQEIMECIKRCVWDKALAQKGTPWPSSTSAGR